MKSEISREIVLGEISRSFLEEGVVLQNSMLSKPVMELGVDSMTYAIIVARLERLTGSDPFTENPNIPYPKTLEEFIFAYCPHD